MTDGGQDVRMIELKCPSCGATLQVSPDKEKAQCDHCGGSVLILDARKGTTRLDTAGSDAPVDEQTSARAVKFLIIGVAFVIILSVSITVLSSIITVIISVFSGLLHVILGIFLSGLIR